jgi:hypothetical protein
LANPGLNRITAGGANAPICHGAGITHDTLSDLVRQIEYVDANGDVQAISDPQQLKAAAGAFGLLGMHHFLLKQPPRILSCPSHLS